MKILVTICRFLVGGLFIFSGFVKAVDPLGTSYKMIDYFNEFGMDYMVDFSLPFAVIMNVLEFVVGFTLLIGYKRKLTTFVLFLTIVFFTFLTGFTYLSGYEFEAWYKLSSWTFNELNMKVTDCGCFGDFLKLKPWESFYKDLVLLVLILVIMAGNKHVFAIGGKKSGGVLTAIVTIGSVLFCFSNYVWGLPAFDFRPYKIGNNIIEQMEVIQEAETEYFLIYENEETGEKKEFSLSNIPKTPWKFVDRREEILVPEISANIVNFYVENAEGIEISDDLLHDPDLSFWVVAYDLTKTNTKAFTDKLNQLAKDCEAHNLNFFVLTGNIDDNFRHEHQTAYPFYQGDGIFLKTIIRSNPGLMLVKNGLVLDKFHHRDIPDFAEVKAKHL